MRRDDNFQSPITVIKGRVVQAVYRKPDCPDHAGNPLQEALPPSLTDDQTMVRLAYYTKYEDSQRKASDHVRYLLIQNGLRFFAPLDIHIDLQRRFSNLLRVGYASRNPLSPEFWPQLNTKLDSFDQYADQYDQQPDRLPTTAAGFNIVGLSGIGKSFSVERVLSLTPQVIYHTNYGGKDFTHSQLVWLKLDCPFDGNLRGLCIQFFKTVDSILGTQYTKAYVKERRLQDELLSDMRTIAATHFLGVLVIDEIQRLSLAKSGGADKMLNFFVQVINELGVPVVLMGNFKALAVLSGDFSQMRRGTGQGDLIWDRMENDDQWELFVESLWRFQYTKKSCSLNDKEKLTKKDLEKYPERMPMTLSQVLYEESQGITDFAVKIYMFAQERAIDSGKEIITASIIRSVAKDKLGIPREVLQALRTMDKEVLGHYEDLYVKKFKNYLYQHPEGIRVTGAIKSEPEVKILYEHSFKDNGKDNPPDLVLSLANRSREKPVAATLKSNKRRSSQRDSEKVSESGAQLPKIISGLGKENGELAYEALKQAGYIRSSDEYED